MSNLTPNVTCSIYTSFEDITEMQEEWDAFIESVKGDIFLTFDWCRVWWQFYGKGRSLQLFLFYQENKIVGVIPMFFEIIKLFLISVNIGKIVGGDSTLSQFSIPIHPHFLEPCTRLLMNKLKSRGWHIIIFGPLSGLSENIVLLHKALCNNSNNSKKVSIREGMVQTYFELQPTWEKYLASLRKSQRRQFLRKYSALEKIGTDDIKSFEVILADKENLSSFFKDFVNLHQAHWHGLGKLGHFGDWPLAYAFHNEMAHSQLMHSRLRLMCLRFNNEVMGFIYAYKFGNKYYAILNARTELEIYNKIGIGQLLIGELAKMAINEKMAYIDAMQGRYDYKLMLGGQLAPIKKIIIIKDNLANSLRVKTFHYLSKLIDLCYYRIWFNRLAPKLPLKRKPLWKLWIRIRL